MSDSGMVEKSFLPSFTKGPWKVEDDRYLGDDFNGDRFGIWDDRDFQLAAVIGDVPELNAEANARLIAAAPDLLAALHVFEHAMESGMVDQDLHGALSVARAAIAKATGEQS